MYIFTYMHLAILISSNWGIYTKIDLSLDKVFKVLLTFKSAAIPRWVHRECWYASNLSFHCRRAQDRRQNETWAKAQWGFHAEKHCIRLAQVYSSDRFCGSIIVGILLFKTGCPSLNKGPWVWFTILTSKQSITCHAVLL